MGLAKSKYSFSKRSMVISKFWYVANFSWSFLRSIHIDGVKPLLVRRRPQNAVRHVQEIRPAFPALMSSISFDVAFPGNTHRVSLPSDGTVSSLCARLEELMQVPLSAQKLLFRGKMISASQEGVTLAPAGLRDGIRVEMLGSTLKS
ncbi:hypothetical protein F5141DRAFT_365531 [Pisolithus sp. B1]|nr:hypothetical protein F5141DRAFT_365531 [Pisolithus sp. B1]